MCQEWYGLQAEDGHLVAESSLFWFHHYATVFAFLQALDGAADGTVKTDRWREWKRVYSSLLGKTKTGGNEVRCLIEMHWPVSISHHNSSCFCWLQPYFITIILSCTYTNLACWIKRIIVQKYTFTYKAICIWVCLFICLSVSNE